MADTYLHSVDSPMRDLVELGIAPDDTLFIHSLFKSLGSVAGGAGSVIQVSEKQRDLRDSF